jgi:hypothetical protein
LKGRGLQPRRRSTQGIHGTAESRAHSNLFAFSDERIYRTAAKAAPYQNGCNISLGFAVGD